MSAAAERVPYWRDRGWVAAMVGACPQAYRMDFREWLVANWPIWLAFCERADALREMRREHYSADAILHVIRYETDLREREPTYKVNNSFSADLGRLYNAVAGVEFFRTRERHTVAIVPDYQGI